MKSKNDLFSLWSRETGKNNIVLPRSMQKEEKPHHQGYTSRISSYAFQEGST